MTQDRTPGGHIQREGDWGYTGDRNLRQESQTRPSRSATEERASNPVEMGLMTPAEARQWGARVDQANRESSNAAQVSVLRAEGVSEQAARFAVSSPLLENNIVEAQAFDAALRAYSLNGQQALEHDGLVGPLSRIAAREPFFRGGEEARNDIRANLAVNEIMQVLRDSGMTVSRDDEVVQGIREAAMNSVRQSRER